MENFKSLFTNTEGLIELKEKLNFNDIYSDVASISVAGYHNTLNMSYSFKSNTVSLVSKGNEFEEINIAITFSRPELYALRDAINNFEKFYLETTVSLDDNL